MDENVVLTPLMLSMDSDAKAAWVEFHNTIERELVSRGELYDVRDVASKAADNVARLAALFHVFISKNSNFSNSISAECIEAAGRIVRLASERSSRRFFGELALPKELVDAARLDTWLVGYCKEKNTHLVPIDSSTTTRAERTPEEGSYRNCDARIRRGRQGPSDRGRKTANNCSKSGTVNRRR